MKKKNPIVLFLILCLSLPFITIFFYILADSEVYFGFTSRQINLFIGTLFFGGTTSLVATFLGGYLAILSIKYFRQINYLIILLLIYMLLPAYIHSLAWLKFSQLILHQYILTGLPITLLTQSLYFLPLTTLVWILFYKKLSTNYFDEVRLYKNVHQSLVIVTFEMGRYVVHILFVLVFLLSINDFTLPSIFSYTTYPIEIMSLFSSGTGLKGTFITSLPIFLLATGLSIFLLLNLRKDASISTNESYHNYFVRTHPSLFFFWSVFFLSPFLLISLDLHHSNVLQLLHLFKEEFIFSFYVASLSSLIALFIGYTLAFYAYLNKWMRPFIFTGLLLLFAMPPTIHGMVINKFYQLLTHYLPILSFYSSLPTLHVLMDKTLPLVFFILYLGFTHLNPQKLALFRLDTSSLTTYFIHTTLYDMRKFLPITLIFAFILSISELGGTLMVLPPGKSTLTVTIYNYLHYGSSDTVALLCLMYISLVLSIGFLTYKVYYWLFKGNFFSKLHL